MTEILENSLDTGIEARLNDNAWSASMARRVLGRRKTIIRRRAAGGFALGLFIIIAGYLLYPGGAAHEPGFERMISSQINGTYGMVFTAGNDARSAETVLFSDIDTLVDSALARR
jgi:hypothetical protein